jgi:hypothetical protein
MGLIAQIFRTFFGGNRNVVKETVEVFRPNAEAQASRAHQLDSAALEQLAAEFQHKRTGWFDRVIDGLNRLPRPMMVFGVFGLLIYTPVDPVHMAEVFASWALIPAGMWAIIATIVAFFFGGRQQLYDQDFQAQLAQTALKVPQVIDNIQAIRELRHDSPGVANPGPEAHLALAALEDTDNPALEAWKEAHA